MAEDDLNSDRLLRLSQVLKIIPVSRSGWWAGVKTGLFPKPVKLGKRVTCWKESEVLALVSNGTSGPAFLRFTGFETFADDTNIWRC